MPRIISQMNSASVLDFFPRKPTMALDIAMKFYLRSPAMKQDRLECRIMPNPNKPLRPCIQPNDKSLLTELKVKKKVSFADSRGLALTMVKVFSDLDDDDLEIPFNITELIDNIVNLTTIEREHLVLDFAQPAADYLDFRNRLQTDFVCLENCILKERSLVGTVKVKNLAFQKCVKIRMTSNSWRAFTDHECQYVKDTYAGSDRDTFSFDIALPDGAQLQEKIEFAVCFECNGKTYWDGNKGQNYKIIRSDFKSRHCEPDYSFSLDQFGSPRCSHGIFPEWSSYSGFDKQGPYY
ncbi:protein phosphatase 1 regulatory subunit 3B [Phyllobates terribilis]|uniref:protein phosphatase 1 regulatory subunit 3B n=1 Tax=Phyllobates terribilis TaxID=111132 RepID=UPI003CCABE57